VGDAAYINLEIEALHRRAREMPGQTSRDGSAADELVGKERIDVEDRINLGRFLFAGRSKGRTKKRPSAEQRHSISPMACHQRADTILLKPEWTTFLTSAARLKNEERPSRSEQRTGIKPK
jgi:hypothetical protein